MDPIALIDAEIKAFAKTVWPDLVLPDEANQYGARQYFSDLQELRVNFIDRYANAQKGKTSASLPPYLIVQVGADDTDMSWGLNGERRIPIEIFYLDDVLGDLSPRTAASKIRTELYRLRDEIERNNDPETFQVVEPAIVDVSMENPAVQEFIAKTGSGLIGGSLRWQPGVLLMTEDA